MFFRLEGKGTALPMPYERFLDGPPGLGVEYLCLLNVKQKRSRGAYSSRGKPDVRFMISYFLGISWISDLFSSLFGL